MRCPTCGQQNLPGSDLCAACETPLAPLDLPTPFDKIESSLMADPVAVLAPKPPVTVPRGATLGEAVRRMMDRGVGAVLVTGEAERLVGILTERDFLTKVAGQPTFPELPVADFMTPSPETVRPTDPLAFALFKMDTGGYRHLPVVDGGEQPVGVVSVRDVLRHVTKICRDG
jgi:CBS domain-containing protein